MKRIVDAKGLACPRPVIETKKVFDAMESGEIVTIVDNTTARENIRKFATSKGMTYSIKEEGSLYEITMIKGEGHEEERPQKPLEKDAGPGSVVFVSSKTMGTGEEELGALLIKGYFYTLTEMDQLPWKIIFVNQGVYLALENSPVLNHLKDLAARGVEILACGTCLEYYKVKDELGVGTISNMYDIASALQEAHHVIKP